ncbi:MAG TPA: universal stress protein [Burkholderiales bacterium]
MLELKHLLIPIDGSPVAAKAAEAGIEFARQVGARVTVYYAVDPVPYGFHAEGAPADEPTKVAMEQRARQTGARHVEAIATAARAAGVPCESVVEVAVPDEGILAAAREGRCDAIFMGSHGRRGLKRLLLGSVTSRVLANADRPVIVYRASSAAPSF